MAGKQKKQKKRRTLAHTGDRALAVSEKNWQRILDKFRRRRQELTAGIFQFYWDIGELAEDVLTESESEKSIEQRKYGPHMVEDIAPGIGLQSGVVRDSLKFYRRFKTRKQLDSLCKKGWSWSGLKYLLAIEDPKAQEQFQLAYEAKKYRSGKEMQDAVEKFNKPERKSASRKGGRSAERGSQPMSVVAIKTCCTWLNTGIAQRIPEFLEGFGDFVKDVKKGMPARTAEEGARSVQQIREWVPMLRNLLDKVDVTIAESGL